MANAVREARQVVKSRGAVQGVATAAAVEGVFHSLHAATRGLKVAASLATSPATPQADGPATESLLPEFFYFRSVDSATREIGYVRIWSFLTFDALAFVAEFARIVGVLGCQKLIIDLRGNGGGSIWASEMLLQSLSAVPIAPARFHFIVSEATREMCGRTSELKPWQGSIDSSLLTSEVFSQGIPLTPPEMLAGVSQLFAGPVVLIIDALSYSATDIFAAGFQDHGVGRILGASLQTGAGGANVAPYDHPYLAGLPGFPPLPKGVSFNVAIRRATRVRAREGVPLEGLGVVADAVHRVTKRDVLEGNVDLIAAAVNMFPPA